MKALKYTVVIILLVLAIIVGVAHYYRESLVRKAANAALGSLGMTATELSVRTIGADTIRLSYLEIEQDDGTRYEISDLTFPLTFPSTRAERIEIGQLAVMPADTEAAATPPAPLLRTLLALPGSVPNTEVTVGRLKTSGFPPAQDVVWRTDGPRQRLSLRVGSVEVTVDIDRMDDEAHRLAMNAKANDRPGALSAQLDVLDGAAGVSMVGEAAFTTSPWVPILRSYGLMPAELVALDAELAGPLTIEIDDGETPTARASARLTLAGELAAEYLAMGELSMRLRGELTTPLAASIDYPSLEWSATAGAADLRIDTDSIGGVAVRLSDLACRAGIHCAVRASVTAGAVELDTVTIANAKLAAPLTITVDESGSEDSTRVAVSPGARLTLTGIESPALSVASVETTQLTGARLVADASGWRIDAERLDLHVAAATDREGLLASGPVRFRTLRVRDGGATVDAEVSIQPNAVTASWNGTGIVVPGVAGDVSLRDGRVAAAIALADGDALSAHIDTSHDIAKASGVIAVHDATLRFDSGKLSGRLVHWPYAWDVVAGSWTADLELSWQAGADGIEYAGTMTHRADALAGQYQDTAFAGLSTTLSADLDSTSGISVAPASLEVALVDVGLPLEQIAANYALDVEQQAVRVDKLSLSTLGGHIAAEPFRFGLNEEENDITLRPQSIQLPFIMNLVDFGDIQLTGSISGVIPVTIRDMKLTISNGQLQSDPPGGVIRYRPGVELEEAGTSESALDLVSRALANFQFDSLTSNVDYNENGDLQLQMRLSGINPDMDDTQPVILNLGVDNNIPQLLRSLRATRSIEDILSTVR